MGVRCRKSINLGGGFRVNLSKSGIGYSWGTKGYRVTKTTRGSIRRTVSIPGTGISYSSETSARRRMKSDCSSPAIPTSSSPSVHPIDVYDIERINSSSVENMRPAEYDDLFRTVRWTIALNTACLIATLLLVFINPFVAILPCMISVWIKCRGIHLDYEYDDYAREKWEKESLAWKDLGNCQKLWYVTAKAKTEGRTNAGATSGAAIAPLQVGRKLPWFLKTDLNPVILKISKQSIVFMPDRILVLEGMKLGAISYDDVEFKFGIQPFAGDIGAPKETEIMEYRWMKVNKNGTPDKRFKNNRQIPVYKLGSLHLTSASGLNLILLTSKTGPIEELEKLYSSNVGASTTN